MLKIAAIICSVLGVVTAVSGYIFISRYDISGGSTSVIEASLMQIAHLRYLVASVFGLAAAVFISAHHCVLAIQGGKSAEQQIS
jgi:hypothetical protein